MIASALKAFDSEYQSPPKGTPSEIFGMLFGNTDKEIVFLEPKDFDLQNGVAIDPWRNEYRIKYHLGKPQVWSISKDQIDQSGSEASDDITSWN